ncbi:MAG: LysR substrate-binding domain-containing protein, partial [Pseudomonadota bacterium]
DETDIEFVPLLPSRNVVACRLNHPLTRDPDPQLRAITEYGWVAPPTNSPLDLDLRATMRMIDAGAARVRFRSPTSAGIRSYLENTDCLAVLPESVVAAMARHHDVTTLGLALPGPTRTVGMASLIGHEQTLLVKRIRAHFKDRFQALAAERNVP